MTNRSVRLPRLLRFWGVVPTVGLMVAIAMLTAPRTAQTYAPDGIEPKRAATKTDTRAATTRGAVQLAQYGSVRRVSRRTSRRTARRVSRRN